MLFCSKAGAPEYNNDIECCWPYMIDQHPFPPVLAKNGRVLPIFSTLLSLFLAILCSLPVGYSIEQTSTDHESDQQTTDRAPERKLRKGHSVWISIASAKG